MSTQKMGPKRRIYFVHK